MLASTTEPSGSTNEHYGIIRCLLPSTTRQRGDIPREGGNIRWPQRDFPKSVGGTPEHLGMLAVHLVNVHCVQGIIPTSP